MSKVEEGLTPKALSEANKEVVKDWVKALRSGEYKQIQEKLRTKDGFCCLGVLCDLKAKADPKAVWADGHNFEIGLYQGDTTPPMPIAKWLIPNVDIDGMTEVWNIFTDMNDLHGSTFDEIANYIEKATGLKDE